MSPKSAPPIPSNVSTRLQKLGSQIIKIDQQIKDLEEQKRELKEISSSLCNQHKIDKFTGEDFRLNHIISITQVTDDTMLLENGVTMDVIEKSKRPIVKDYYSFTRLKEKEDR